MRFCPVLAFNEADLTDGYHTPTYPMIGETTILSRGDFVITGFGNESTRNSRKRLRRGATDDADLVVQDKGRSG